MLGAQVLRIARLRCPPGCLCADRHPRAARTPSLALFRLDSDHFRTFHDAHQDRFAATRGDWRGLVPVCEPRL